MFCTNYWPGTVKIALNEFAPLFSNKIFFYPFLFRKAEKQLGGVLKIQHK